MSNLMLMGDSAPAPASNCRPSLPMPVIQFGIADPALSVFVDLDVRFDIALEGKSRIIFLPGGNPLNSVLIRTFQWPVQVL
jgi:hypothetical protein